MHLRRCTALRRVIKTCCALRRMLKGCTWGFRSLFGPLRPQQRPLRPQQTRQSPSRRVMEQQLPQAKSQRERRRCFQIQGKQKRPQKRYAALRSTALQALVPGKHSLLLDAPSNLTRHGLQGDSLRKFYESLHRQRPESMMAKKW